MIISPLRALVGLATLAVALPQLASAAWMDRTEAIMGTRVYVQVWADDPVRGDEAMEAVMAEMRRIDDLMSHYKPESQLSQINQHANEEPVQVDKELFDLIKLSTYYSQITDGAFDITYASVGYLYDYRKHIHPTEAQIKAALPAVNWRNMLLDEAHHTVRFEHPGHAHRSRRHRQGLRGRPRHRPSSRRAASSTRWSPPAATAASSAITWDGRGSIAHPASGQSHTRW